MTKLWRQGIALLTIALLTHTTVPQAPIPARTPVLLSTDVGNEIDDQWVITYLLLQPRLEVLGILSAHAPSLPDPSAQTSHRILVDLVENRLRMHTHPPLLAGSDLPLTDSKTPQSSPAIRFLLEISKPFSPEHRLDVLAIGAPTDVASAILTDPSVVDRIRVIQMGFIDEHGGDEYNILNDPRAEQVLLNSRVPLVIGPASVCRADLAMTFSHARELLATRGPIGAWLWQEYQDWYFRNVKPLRVDDFSKPWYIWDTVTVAYVLGLTKEHTAPRPIMRDDATFSGTDPQQTVTWITHVDSEQLWSDFIHRIDQYQHIRP
jgi:purine nucleosidase